MVAIEGIDEKRIRLKGDASTAIKAVEINDRESNLTKNGEITSSSADAIRKVFILMYADCLINIRDSGVEFLD